MSSNLLRLTLERWVDNVGPHGDSYRAPTGEPYVALVSGGIKDEGERFPYLYASPELAMDAWANTASEYAGDHCGTLYWRELPVVDEIRPGQWAVYSRLLISDKPAVKAA